MFYGNSSPQLDGVAVLCPDGVGKVAGVSGGGVDGAVDGADAEGGGAAGGGGGGCVQGGHGLADKENAENVGVFFGSEI